MYRNRIIEHLTIDSSELRRNPLNHRRHPDSQRHALRSLLSTVGVVDELLAYRDPEHGLTLVDGEARWSEGGSWPVAVLDLTPDEALTVLAMLDRIGSQAEIDPEALIALLDSLPTQARQTAGAAWSDDELAALLADARVLPEPGGGGDEFDVTPEDGPTRTELGQLWSIGGVHRLLVGDCTDAANVARLMGGERADIVFTSPPYTDQRDYTIGAFDWTKLMCGAFEQLAAHMEKGGHILINLGLSHKDRKVDFYWNDWLDHCAENGWPLFGWYVWDKGSGMPGNWNGRLAPAHEFVFHFNQESDSANKWIETTGRKEQGGLRFRQKNGALKEPTSPSKFGQLLKVPDSVIRINREQSRGIQTENHPAVFSVEFAEFGMNTWSSAGDVAYEPFTGSGTTLIAAHRTGRRCYGMEIAPRYADVILRRAESEGLTVERAST